jgi:hypothetical protein
MEAGIYGVAYTLVDPSGEESGLSKITFLTLTAGQGIEGLLFSILSGYRFRVYITTANGEELRQAIEFPADTTTIQIQVPEEGRTAETFGLEPPPKGHIIRAFNSRLLIGTHNYVYFTETFRPHLWDPRNYITTNGFTLMVEPVKEGVFVADRKGVLFYKGDNPGSWQVVEASPETVIYGTSIVISGGFFGGELAQYDEVAVWLTDSWYQIGLPSGEVVRLNAAQIKTPDYVQGCVASILTEGRKQLITPVNSNLLATAGVALDSAIT